MSPTDEKGETVPLSNLDDLGEKESCFKRRKMYIIIGVAVALAIVLVVVLCVCLIKKKPQRTYNNNITLKVYSNSDDKEILFFSDEFDIEERFIQKENISMLIDGEKNSFNKSKKLKKGEHTISYSFDNIIISCHNMFKDCEDITEININMTYAISNTGYMFSGCSSLQNLNIININTSSVKNMGRMFNGCKNLKTLHLSLFNSINKVI